MGTQNTSIMGMGLYTHAEDTNVTHQHQHHKDDMIVKHIHEAPPVKIVNHTVRTYSVTLLFSQL